MSPARDIILTAKQLRSFAKEHPEIKSHVNIVAHNLTALASQDDPDSDDHTAMRKLTARNIQGLREAIEKSRAAVTA